MLDRSYNDILKNINLIPQLDASICKFLAIMCISIKDDEVAEILMKRVRSHISMSESEKNMYTVDFYLEYVNDILEITAGMNHIPSINGLRSKVKNIYEIFLYNKAHLIAALNFLEREDTLDLMRENYWMN